MNEQQTVSLADAKRVIAAGETQATEIGHPASTASSVSSVSASATGTAPSRGSASAFSSAISSTHSGVPGAGSGCCSSRR
jgi:hypothetical protein